LEIWEEACRVEEELRDDIEEESSCDEESVSSVGASVVAMEPLEVMVDCDLAARIEEKEERKGGR
jgi:hypothetical protein